MTFFIDMWLRLFGLPTMAERAANNDRIWRSLTGRPPRLQYSENSTWGNSVVPAEEVQESERLALICRNHVLIAALNKPPAKPRTTPPGPPKSFTDSKIAGALAFANGNQTHAARLLDCSRRTVARYLERQREIAS